MVAATADRCVMKVPGYGGTGFLAKELVQDVQPQSMLRGRACWRRCLVSFPHHSDHGVQLAQLCWTPRWGALCLHRLISQLSRSGAWHLSRMRVLRSLRGVREAALEDLLHTPLFETWNSQQSKWVCGCTDLNSRDLSL